MTRISMMQLSLLKQCQLFRAFRPLLPLVWKPICCMQCQVRCYPCCCCCCYYYCYCCCLDSPPHSTVASPLVELIESPPKVREHSISEMLLPDRSSLSRALEVSMYSELPPVPIKPKYSVPRARKKHVTWDIGKQQQTNKQINK